MTNAVKAGSKQAGQIITGDRGPRSRRKNVASDAGRTACPGCTRIYQLVWKKRKISSGFGLRKDGDGAGRRWVIAARALVIAKEEELVLNDWSTGRTPKEIPAQLLRRQPFCVFEINGLFSHLLALKKSLWRNSNTSPWNLLAPDLMVALMMPPA